MSRRASPDWEHLARARLAPRQPGSHQVLRSHYQPVPRGSIGPTITRPGQDLDKDTLTRLLPPWKVVVLDCNCHSFDDVEVALCRTIRGMTRAKAHQHAFEIHTTGASVVARAPKEQAELYQEKLAGYGLRVTIEGD